MGMVWIKIGKYSVYWLFRQISFSSCLFWNDYACDRNYGEGGHTALTFHGNGTRKNENLPVDMRTGEKNRTSCMGDTHQYLPSILIYLHPPPMYTGPGLSLSIQVVWSPHGPIFIMGHSVSKSSNLFKVFNSSFRIL